MQFWHTMGHNNWGSPLPTIGNWLSASVAVAGSYLLFEAANFYTLADHSLVDVRLISMHMVEQMLQYAILSVGLTVLLFAASAAFIARPQRTTLRHCFFLALVLLTVGNVAYEIPFLYEYHFAPWAELTENGPYATYIGAAVALAWGISQYFDTKQSPDSAE